MTDHTSLFIKMSLDAWNSYIRRTEELFNALTDEQLQTPIAAGKNTVQYLMGHLLAVHDGFFPLFGLGDRMYPDLKIVYLDNPDNSGQAQLSADALRAAWNQVHARLAATFSGFTESDWFARHNSVTPEAFAVEPHRNRLNVLLNRTNHLAYHVGQLILLKI